MLSIFTTARPFRPPFDVIQRNAVASWLGLDPQVQVILLGSDEGTAEVAAEFGVIHVPKVECNRFGAPRIDALFAAAESVAEHNTMCFINADIILTDDFPTTVKRVTAQIKRSVIIGRRWNLDIESAWDFGSQVAYQEIRDVTKTHGSLAPVGYMDYFVYPKGFWEAVPPFAIGAGRLDNWLVHRAISLGAALVDATSSITAIHQNHDTPEKIPTKYEYGGHLPGLEENTRICNDNWDPLWIGIGTVNECSHILTPAGMKRRWRLADILRGLAANPRTRPIAAPLIRARYPAQTAGE